MARPRPAAGVAAAAAFAFLVVHLAAGTGVLDDLDAINFAMGLRDFDVAQHQPHPPGYPIYVLLGKLLLWLQAASGAIGDGPGRPLEARGLSFLSMIAGALAAFPLLRLFRILGQGDERLAVWATLLTLACPLFWVTASRPLSDMPGLAAALAVQAVLATAFARQRGWHGREVSAAEQVSSGRLIVLGALLAGLLAGLRSQTIWLTVPVLALVITDRAGRGAAGAIVGSGVTFAIGALAWLGPLVAVTGGPAAYWRALSSQAGEDIEGVDMLLTSTQPVRRLAFNLLQSFVLPWASIPLAVAVLAVAAAGAAALARRDRRSLALLAALAGPYAAFHLLVQENVTTRYALPLVPAVCFLAVRGLHIMPSAAAAAGAAALAGVSLAFGHPALIAYTSQPAPIFRVFDDMRAGEGGAGGAHGSGRAPTLAMHRRIFTESKRARQWLSNPEFPWQLLDAPRGHEWLEMASYWRNGGTGKVWFLADPRRTDLALIDPESRHPNGQYAWPFASAPGLVGGARPNEMDWWVIESPPGWFAGEGWALTPETAGVAGVGERGPARGGARAWLRRRAGAARLVIGGRNLGAPGDPRVRFTLSIDGRELDAWEVEPSPGFFLRSLELPSGLLAAPAAAPSGGGSGLAELVVRASAADGSPQPVQAAIEQFDVRGLDRVQFAFDRGWHEHEHDPATGLDWHWSSERADLRVWHGGRPVLVRLDVESPLKTFGEPPIVTVSAGERELARIEPRDAFTIELRVPPEALDAAGGRLTLATSRVFVPAEHVPEGDPRRQDRRRLGLRVLGARVTAAP